MQTRKPTKKVWFPRRLTLELSGNDMLGNVRSHVPTCGNKLCVNPAHQVCGDVARFYNSIVKLSEKRGSCWVWQGAHDKDMYGIHRVSYKDRKPVEVRATHYSWFIHTGFMPKALYVCHKCDHPYCVNPDHLFLGTNQENTQDRHQKGRDAKGIHNGGGTKLTDDMVREIRQLRREGATLLQLADKYDVVISRVSAICRLESWKHVV